MSKTVIKVTNLQKTFKLPNEKISSVKSVFTNFGSFRKQSYQTQNALNGVSFEVQEGEFFGIVGRNGSGKSTLLKLLAGIYQPTKGQVKTEGKIVPFIELGVGFNPELTGRENVYLNGAMLGFNDKEVLEKYEEIVDFAELHEHMEQKLKNYSSGMQVRLAFSVATILADSDILLLDEVLAVGDADFQRKCFSYFRDLKRMKKTVIFVTHDMSAVTEYCDRAALIEGGKISRVGKPEKIASEYQKLFMDNDNDLNNKFKKESTERWGNEAAMYKNIKADVTESSISVSTVIKVNKRVESIYFGIHIYSNDGVEITAMNNRMIGHKDIKSVQPGENINLEWGLMNIFNDGNYRVALTMVDDEIGIIDWVEEAAFFDIKRSQRSTTHVIPPTTIKIER